MKNESETNSDQPEIEWQEWFSAEEFPRLDACVVNHYPELTRTKAQRLIERGKVLLNGSDSKSSQRVRVQDKVSVQLEADPINVGTMPENIPLDITYEDDEFVIINKPAGMVMHPAHGNWNGTLVNALLYHYGQNNLSTGIRSVNVHQELRPGIVHRIDKNTSGLVVVAKNDGAQVQLCKQFHDHSIHRIYRGICWGVLPKKGEWRGNIARDPSHRQRMAIHARGKPATTRFRLLESFQVASYFEAELETGRTHQIRVHFSHNGFPLVGDGMYLSATRSARRNKETAMKILKKLDPKFAAELFALAEVSARQMLHAQELGFKHPLTEEKVKYSSELPSDFEKILADFRAFSAAFRV